jgi:hypothetical protein
MLKVVVRVRYFPHGTLPQIVPSNFNSYNHLRLRRLIKAVLADVERKRALSSVKCAYLSANVQ